MPVEPATKNGRRGFRFGKTGKVFTFKAGDKASRERAKAKAARQGRAIKAAQRRRR